MYGYIFDFRYNVGGFLFFNLGILRYANMILEFDNEALESY